MRCTYLRPICIHNHPHIFPCDSGSKLCIHILNGVGTLRRTRWQRWAFNGRILISYWRILIFIYNQVGFGDIEAPKHWLGRGDFAFKMMDFFYWKWWILYWKWWILYWKWWILYRKWWILYWKWWILKKLFWKWWLCRLHDALLDRIDASAVRFFIDFHYFSTVLRLICCDRFGSILMTRTNAVAHTLSFLHAQVINHGFSIKKW